MTTLPNKEKSLWRESYGDVTRYPEATEDTYADVVIIGAGITGLTAAYLLKQAGLSVVVLEKETVGSGTTGRTTGKVTSQHNTIYADMKQRLGEKLALHYAQANQTAVEMIEKIIKAEAIECDWQKDDSYIFTADRDRVPLLVREAEVAASLGLPASFELSTPLPFEVEGAVKFTDQAKMDAQKYLLGLARLVHDNGSSVHENSKVITFRDGDEPYVRTLQAKITAKCIIVATKIPSFPLAARAGYAALEYPTESFSVAAPLDSELRGMYISPDSDHHSILPIEVSGRPYLIVVGAGGNIAGMRFGKRARYARLSNYASKHFQVGSITNMWSDMDYLPYDYYPLVGKVYPWSKNMYSATGFMKWGLTNGTAAAMILRDLILGHKNVWIESFTTTRTRPIRSIPRAIVRHFS